jgi:DNA/RNA-binding domain of Phe-tRNA-synthetase-like protein
MMFSHSPAIWQDYPELAAGVAYLRGVHTRASVDAAVARYIERATSSLHAGSESNLQPIQAWRRAFSRMQR